MVEEVFETVGGEYGRYLLVAGWGEVAEVDIEISEYNGFAVGKTVEGLDQEGNVIEVGGG